jgi:hypothetical protein
MAKRLTHIDKAIAILEDEIRSRQHAIGALKAQRDVAVGTAVRASRAATTRRTATTGPSTVFGDEARTETPRRGSASSGNTGEATREPLP